ncbi:MAG: hypothetical protein ACYTF6_05435 [Planctomycetota bacterium]
MKVKLGYISSDQLAEGYLLFDVEAGLVRPAPRRQDHRQIQSVPPLDPGRRYVHLVLAEAVHAAFLDLAGGEPHKRRRARLASLDASGGRPQQAAPERRPITQPVLEHRGFAD